MEVGPGGLIRHLNVLWFEWPVVATRGIAFNDTRAVNNAHMNAHTRSALPTWLGPPFFMLCAFMVILTIAGGASRHDVSGQVPIRFSAVALLVGLALFGRRNSLVGLAAPAAVLTAMGLLAALQLVPLPMSWWQGLPAYKLLGGHDLATLGEESRPFALVPSLALNSLFSLVVPLATLALLACLPEQGRARLPIVLVTAVCVTALIGIFQFSGADVRNPLVNKPIGHVSGLFANRNHFALFLACGCLLTPALAFSAERQSQGRLLLAIALNLVFILTILASGSRAGIMLSAIAVAGACLIARRDIGRTVRRYPRRLVLMVALGAVGLAAAIIGLSVLADRAESINRLLANDVNEDMRRRALPTVIALVRSTFPLGAGLGSFDALFRANEPFELLKPTYFNHAHNDFLEVALDTGVAGLSILGAAIIWFVVAGIRVWRGAPSRQRSLGRIGWMIILLVLLASVVDYPARTPMIMALLVVAAWWLGEGAARSAQSPLPEDSGHL